MAVYSSVLAVYGFSAYGWRFEQGSTGGAHTAQPGNADAAGLAVPVVRGVFHSGTGGNLFA